MPRPVCVRDAHQAVGFAEWSEDGFHCLVVAGRKQGKQPLVVILLSREEEIPLLDLVIKIRAEGGGKALEQTALDKALNCTGSSYSHLPKRLGERHALHAGYLYFQQCGGGGA